MPFVSAILPHLSKIVVAAASSVAVGFAGYYTKIAVKNLEKRRDQAETNKKFPIGFRPNP